MTGEESVPMKNLDGNGVDEPEPTEKSPLNGTDVEAANEKELEANGANGKEKELLAEDNGKSGGLAALLAQTRVRLVVAGLVIILAFLAALIACVVLSAGSSVEEWVEDATPRALKLIPTPREAPNLIHYREGHGEEGAGYQELVDEINNLYAIYSPELLGEGGNLTTCEDGKEAPEGKACFFDIKPIKELCSNETGFGYPEGKPCIFIQLNYELLRNFTPELFSKAELQSTPGLPFNLKGLSKMTGPYVDCIPNNIIDEENAGKVIRVPKDSTFNMKYFPVSSVAEYMPPLIAIKFDRPAPGYTFGMTCTLWAKNIGTRTVFDDATNTTKTETIDATLPVASLPFNFRVD